MRFTLLTATLTSGPTSIDITGPALAAELPPERILEAFDELRDSLEELGWTATDGNPVAITGRVNFAPTKHHSRLSEPATVYDLAAPDRATARAHARTQLATAQIAAAFSYSQAEYGNEPKLYPPTD